MIKRVIPYPIMSLALLAMWLLLHNSVEPAIILGGVIAALAAPWAMAALETEPLRVRSFTALIKLVGIVLIDIHRSNFAVGTIILRKKKMKGAAGFIHVPLDLRNRFGLTLLALIITTTPGTLWVQYNSGRGTLLLHVLDLVDEEDWIKLIKHRYERLLMEAFEP